jgi:hypothetical protein
MNKTTGLALASLLFLPLAACDGVKTVPGLAPDLAPRALAESICPAAYRCCMPDQLMSNDQAGTDVASCEMKTEAAFTSQVAGIQASEKQGRVTYDGDKVQKCVEYLKTAPCPELQNTGHFTGLPACASFIQPQVEVGGACSQTFECKSSFCDRTGLADGQDGVCRNYASTGEACSSALPCGYGSQCDPATNKCVPLPAGARPVPGGLCFYSSACSYAGGDRGAFSLLGLGLMLGALARRRRAIQAPVLPRQDVVEDRRHHHQDRGRGDHEDVPPGATSVQALEHGSHQEAFAAALFGGRIHLAPALLSLRLGAHDLNSISSVLRPRKHRRNGRDI